MTAEDALQMMLAIYSQAEIDCIWMVTYMQAMPKIPTTAIFVCRFMCSLRTTKIGKIPTVKSQNAAKAL